MDSTLQVEKRIKSFDGLRGLAILLVLFCHATDTIEINNNLWQLVRNISIELGSLGVRIFFALSGYLITMLMIQEIKKNNNLNLRNFYIRRSMRILPILYCFIGVIVIINLILRLEININQFIAALTFTLNYSFLFCPDGLGGSEKGDWFLGHLWTLSIEEQFYLLWPICVSFCKQNFRKILFLSLLIILFLPVLRISLYFLCYFFFPAQRGIPGAVLAGFDTILAGCLMCLLNNFPRYSQYIHKLKGSVIALLLIYPIFISPILKLWLNARYSLSIGVTIDSIILGILVCWLHANPLSYVSRLLSMPVFVFIGKISYSLYLWQQLFLTKYNTTLSGLFPYNIGFSFMVAMISYYVIEQPCLTLKNRLLK